VSDIRERLRVINIVEERQGYKELKKMIVWKQWKEAASHNWLSVTDKT
jgi:hypothetical protein